MAPRQSVRIIPHLKDVPETVACHRGFGGRFHRRGDWRHAMLSVRQGPAVALMAMASIWSSPARPRRSGCIGYWFNGNEYPLVGIVRFLVVRRHFVFAQKTSHRNLRVLVHRSFSSLSFLSWESLQ